MAYEENVLNIKHSSLPTSQLMKEVLTINLHAAICAVIHTTTSWVWGPGLLVCMAYKPGVLK
jgi:hypothetical protein